MSRLRSLPIRWRLALTTAGLAFVILVLFAAVTGMLLGRQLHTDFDNELRSAASELASEIDLVEGPDGLRPTSNVVQGAGVGEAAIRIVGTDGRLLAATSNAPAFGNAGLNRVRKVGDYRVAAKPIRDQFLQLQGFLQYGKPESSINATIARVRILLALGVLGGTGLALLAGLTVARRAMRPIANLTGAAQEVARTRDPTVMLPDPQADDEVAELQRTLEQMLAALDGARAETEAALDRQRRFVADASHELRTPLTSILANLELLEAELHGEQEESVRSALRSSRRMRRLVADLLLLARADTGRRGPAVAVDLGSTVRDAAAEVAAIADGHDLSLDLAPEVVVEGSPDDLHRLTLNLLENAVRHTPPGTGVHAVVRRDGEQAVLEVADDGPGIPPSERERVFERFTSGVRDSGQGSGLGLAIVRAVAESHGGAVTLDEAPHGGARFTVTVPVAVASAAVPATPAVRTAYLS